METSVKSNKLKITAYDGFQILLALVWMETVLLRYFRAGLLRIPVLRLVPDIIIAGIFITAVIFAFRRLHGNITWREILMYVIIAAFYGLSFLLRPSNREGLAYYAPIFLLNVLPMLFIGVSVDIEKSIKMLYHISLVSMYAMFAYKFFFEDMNQSLLLAGDMDKAYNLLPHLLLILLFAFNKPNFFNIISSVLGFIFLCFLGTRGPILLTVIFVLMYTAFFRKSRRPVLARILLIAACIAIALLFKPVVEMLNQLAVKLGMSTRIFEKLINGEIADSSNRNLITLKCFAEIKANPILGYGFAGSMLFDINYPHNIFIELLLDFGIFAGLTAFILLLILLFKGLRGGKSNYERGFIFALICSSFFKLFLSGTFMNEPLLFLLIGLCIETMRKNKKNDMLNQYETEQKIESL